MNKLTKNQVSIELQTKITSFLNIAYPMCFILSEPKLKTWYYEHFVHIFSQIWYDSFFRVDFLDSSKYFSEILNIRPFTMKEMYNRNILDFIIEQIDYGYCLNIFTIDEFYIPQRPAYRKHHSNHEILIYGYDNDSQKLLVIGYNIENRFIKFEYDYKSFEEGFYTALKNPPDDLCYALNSLKLRPFHYEYPFELNRFYRELTNYVYSKVDSKKKFFAIGDAKEADYGFQVYNKLIDTLNQMIEGDDSKKVNYTTVHFLYEHKQLLMERLQFISENHVISDDFKVLIRQFNQTIEDFNDIKNKWLKIALANSNFKNIFAAPDKNSLIKLVTMVQNARNREYEMLLKVISELEGYITNL